MAGTEDKRGEINSMSYGKIMTSMLIPKDSRTNPKRVLGGIAFLAFICFFLFASLGRGCQRQQQENGQPGTAATIESRSE